MSGSSVSRSASAGKGEGSRSARGSRLPRHLRGVSLPDGADLASLSARYGTDRPPWGVAIVAVLVIVPFLGWVIWAAFAHANQELRWETVGFSDITDQSVTVTFDVFLPSGATAECTVRATDARGVEVGRAQVPVQSDGTSASVVYALPVTARPSSAFVESCRLAENTK